MPHDGIEESHDLLHDESITDGHAYEQQEFLDKRRVIGFMGFLAFLMIAAIVLTRFLEPFLASQNQPDAPTTPFVDQLAQSPPSAILQASPKADMMEFLASENAVLQSYGWVDQKAGIARIPIDDAKSLSLQEPGYYPIRSATEPPAGRVQP